MAVCPDFTLQMMMMRSSGWQTSEGEAAYERRRFSEVETEKKFFCFYYFVDD